VQKANVAVSGGLTGAAREKETTGRRGNRKRKNTGGEPIGKKIPAKKLAAAAKKGGKLGKRARLAQTLKRINRKK